MYMSSFSEKSIRNEFTKVHAIQQGLAS